MMSNLQDLRQKVKTLSILIVDDEHEVAEGTEVFMKKFFSKVKTASNAESALALFNTHYRPDVLLTDIKMPGLNGWELIQKLRKQDSHLFIAVMTGSPEATETELSLCDIYLNKPIGINEITQMLEKITLKYKL